MILTELFYRNSFNLNKRLKIQRQTILLCKVWIWIFVACRLWLRYKYFFDFQGLIVLRVFNILYCANTFINKMRGAISRPQRYKNIYKIKTLFWNKILNHLKIRNIKRKTRMMHVNFSTPGCHDGLTKKSDKTMGEINVPYEIFDSQRFIPAIFATYELLNIHPKYLYTPMVK